MPIRNYGPARRRKLYGKRRMRRRRLGGEDIAGFLPLSNCEVTHGNVTDCMYMYNSRAVLFRPGGFSDSTLLGVRFLAAHLLLRLSLRIYRSSDQRFFFATSERVRQTCRQLMLQFFGKVDMRGTSVMTVRLNGRADVAMVLRMELNLLISACALS